MHTTKELYYEKRGKLLVKNLLSRHFDAFYCANSSDALKKALEWIPENASVGWGGTVSAEQIGLLDAVRNGPYRAIDRESFKTQEEREHFKSERSLSSFYFSLHNSCSIEVSSFLFFQRQPNQSIRLICHKQWNIQNVIIQLQIVQ